MPGLRMPRAQQLTDRLERVRQALADNADDPTLVRLAENEVTYIEAEQRRERYIREVFARSDLPVGFWRKVVEVTGVSRQRLDQIRRNG